MPLVCFIAFPGQHRQSTRVLKGLCCAAHQVEQFVAQDKNPVVTGVY